MNKQKRHTCFVFVSFFFAVLFLASPCRAVTKNENVATTAVLRCIEQEEYLQEGGKAVLEVTPGIDWATFCIHENEGRNGQRVFAWNAVGTRKSLSV